MVLPLATLASAGSFLSGASSFLGALGIGGKKKKGPDFQTQLQMQRAAEISGFDTKMELSKKHGIHPLTMLGAPSFSNGGFYMDGGKPEKGIDLEAMGQGIDRMANVGRSNVQRKLDDLALEQAQLSNDYLRVQIAGAQKAISRSGSTIPMDSADTSGNFSPLLPLRSAPGVTIVKDEQTAKNPKDTGKTAGSHAGFMTIDLGNGYTADVPKTDEAWAEAIGELPLFYKYPKMAEIAGKRFGAKNDLNNRLYKKKHSKKWLAPWDPRKYKK